MTGRIILIGMPASGKTTVGRAVAQALSLPFHDCDREGERLTGRTIPEIFAAEGEEAFRAVESRALAALCTAEAPCVIATGGGAVLSAENRRLLRRSGTVFWLDRDLENIMSTDCSGRPLLSGGAEALRTLYKNRRGLYAACAHLLVPDGTITQVTDYILQTAKELL